MSGIIPTKAKGTIRGLKNFAKGFSEIQIKVREATSNETVGPNGALMNEIARATFSHHLFIEIMGTMDKRLNDSGKNWRHVFKTLTLLEYLIQNGSEEVVAHCKANMYVIKTLREFQHIDESGKDQGLNVRHKAKDITAILSDESKLKELRSHITQQMSTSYGSYGGGYGTNEDNNPYGTYGGSDYGAGANSTGYGYGNSNSYSSPNPYGQSNEDRDLQLAIEESKRMSQPQKPVKPQPTNEDADVQKAIEMSLREQEMRENSRAKENELVLLEGYDPNPTPNNPLTQHMRQYDHFGNPLNGNGSSGKNDLLDLDPLSFTDTNSYGMNNNYMSQQPLFQTTPVQSGFNPNNPFAQTSNTNTFQTNPSASKYSGLESAFTAHNNPPPAFQTAPQPPKPANNASGFNAQFNDGFDGGYNAKLMPHQTERNANAALATIARNSNKIDPFANLAAQRSNSPGPGSSLFDQAKPSSNLNPISATGPNSSSSNPFQGTWSNATANNMFQTNTTATTYNGAANGTPNSLNIFDQPQTNNENVSNSYLNTGVSASNPFAAYSNPPVNNSSNNLFQTTTNGNTQQGQQQQNLFF